MCKQGRKRMLSPTTKSIIQITHSLFFFVPSKVPQGRCWISPKRWASRTCCSSDRLLTGELLLWLMLKLVPSPPAPSFWYGGGSSPSTRSRLLFSDTNNDWLSLLFDFRQLPMMLMFGWLCNIQCHHLIRQTRQNQPAPRVYQTPGNTWIETPYISYDLNISDYM